METIRPTLWLQARAKKQQERERLRLEVLDQVDAALNEPAEHYTRAEIVIFCSEFDLQVLEIKRIYQLLEQKAAKSKAAIVSSELVESIGYWLHNLYSAYEDLFKLVASFWENSIHNQSRYHRELLTRMRLDIPEVRPALIRQEKSFKNLDELRGFRHVFRHTYSYGLDDERVFFLVERVFKAKDDILADIGRFRFEIDKMIQSSPE